MTMLSDEELAAIRQGRGSKLIHWHDEANDEYGTSVAMTGAEDIDALGAHIDALTAQRDRAVADKTHAWAVRDRVTAFAARTAKTYRAEQEALIAQRDRYRNIIAAMESGLTQGPILPRRNPDLAPPYEQQPTLDALLGFRVEA